VFLISNFRRVMNVVLFLLVNTPASEYYVPTFRNTVCSTFLGPVRGKKNLRVIVCTFPVLAEIIFVSSSLIIWSWLMPCFANGVLSFCNTLIYLLYK
jgi:hypothetical protein